MHDFKGSFCCRFAGIADGQPLKPAPGASWPNTAALSANTKIGNPTIEFVKREMKTCHYTVWNLTKLSQAKRISKAGPLENVSWQKINETL